MMFCLRLSHDPEEGGEGAYKNAVLGTMRSHSVS
jgi:hypothetical protein